MRILLVTPLYPPDIAEPAPYVKELSRRLSETDRVTILAYNHIPELVEGVTIVPIEKRAPGIIRILRFTFALLELSKSNDVLIVQNGVSVELPLLISRMIRKVPTLFRIGDTAALKYTERSWFKRAIFSRVVEQVEYILVHDTATDTLIQSYAPRTHTPTVVTNAPPCRPEVLPFAPYPEDDLNAFSTAWTNHRDVIRTILKKYERTL